jgi:hypothetical protein
MGIHFILTWLTTHAVFIAFAHCDSVRSYVIMSLCVHQSFVNVLYDSLQLLSTFRIEERCILKTD